MGRQSRLRARKRVLKELVTDGSLSIDEANGQYRLEKGRLPPVEDTRVTYGPLPPSPWTAVYK